MTEENVGEGIWRRKGGREGSDGAGTLGAGKVLKQMRSARPERANLLMLPFVSIQFYIPFYSACECDTEYTHTHTHTHTLFVAYASSVCLYKQDLGGWWCKNSKKNPKKPPKPPPKPLIDLGRSLGEGKGYPLQYSGLESSMDCIVHEVAKSQIWMSDFQIHFIICKLHLGEDCLFKSIFSAPKTVLDIW